MKTVEAFIEEARTKSYNVLTAAGATKDQCSFYADALRCEYETMYITYRLLAELRSCNNGNNNNGSSKSNNQMDVDSLVATILKLLKQFNKWRSDLEALSERRASIKPLNVDFRKQLATNGDLHTALCTLQTEQVNLSTGEEYRIVDSSQPNKLKVVTGRGEEGYIPALSCILPTPDSNANTALERLQIQLLACWTDSESKMRPLIHQAITASAAQLSKQWASCAGFRRYGASHGGTNTWETRVARRLRRITEAAQNGNTAAATNIDLNRLRKNFCSLENELLWQRAQQLSPMIETVANLDRAVLSYQAFRKQWRQYRHSLRELPVRPINIIVQWDPTAFSDQSKSLRYYEVKLTAEEMVTDEETIFTLPLRRDDESTTSSGGTSHRESVAAEQLTSSSHEENRRFVIRSVVDPRTGSEIAMQAAIEAGIVDYNEGVYKNPSSGECKSIPVAMSEGLIRVEYATMTKSAEKVQSIGLVTIRTQVDNREYSIVSVVDALTGDKLNLEQARKCAIINEVAGYYVDGRTGKHLLLDDAIESGWIEVEYDDESASTDSTHIEAKTYAISEVVDQRSKQRVSFVDALRKGLVDRDTGNYINNLTGEKVFAAEAIRRGFFKSMVVDNPNELDIDVTNRVVSDRIDRVRKNVLRGIRVVAALHKAMAQRQDDQ